MEEPQPNDTSKPKRLTRKKQLQASIESITQQMYQRNRELAETNKTLSLLQTIDALVLESHVSLPMVCGHIAQAVVQATDYTFVGILTRPPGAHSELVLQGWSGSAWFGKSDPPQFSRPPRVKMSHEWFGTDEMTRFTTLHDMDPKYVTKLLGCSDYDVSVIREQLGIQSVYAMKLMARRRIVGLLVVGFNVPITEAQKNMSDGFLGRLSESVGVALDNKLLFEENQRVLHQLKLSNQKLKALDEAKDDFVSMASHQLRTPLTSVKGYISMVLEGDAGKINATQRKLLEQSFASSQRMVYLIADLLNVSRLKTGKFIIEKTPVNIAEVVEQEIGQLKETAAGRSLELTYEMPKKFPTIMLDETKTRQVIMNFIDNAIYYTPAGGKIRVELSETPASVEFKVIDNGIGVPKAERAHLFTKFYRAGNARTARPDGTGLGLFMAKKVIVAQGGAITFETEEGKGSTFGFIFGKTAAES